jgi:hypothetical protein
VIESHLVTTVSRCMLHGKVEGSPNIPFPSLKAFGCAQLLGTGNLDIEQAVTWVENFTTEVDEECEKQLMSKF